MKKKLFFLFFFFFFFFHKKRKMNKKQKLQEEKSAIQIKSVVSYTYGTPMCILTVSDKLFAVGFYDKKLCFFDANTLRETNNITTPAVVCAMALLNDKKIACMTISDDLLIVDVSAFSIIKKMRCPLPQDSIAFLPNGCLVSGLMNGAVKFWNIDTSESNKVSGAHSSRVSSILSITKNRVATASWDHTIKLWDGDTFAHIETLYGHESHVLCIALMSDGILASGSEDKTIRLWDTDTMKQTRVFKYIFPINSIVAASPDHLVFGYKCGYLMSLNVRTYVKRELANFGDTNRIICVEMLKNGIVLFGTLRRVLCAIDFSALVATKRLEDEQEE